MGDCFRFPPGIACGLTRARIGSVVAVLVRPVPSTVSFPFGALAGLLSVRHTSHCGEAFALSKHLVARGAKCVPLAITS